MAREPRIHIPLSLALPAAAAVLAVVAALAVALLMGPDGHLSAPYAPAPGDAGRSGSPTATGPRTGAAAEGPQARRQAEQNTRFEAARAEHEAGRHAEAFASLAVLADEGHCDAARLALQLVHAGPQAYMTTFPASPVQLARWRGGLSACSAKAQMR